MADTFNYNDVELPDEDTVAAVVAEISGTGKSPPLSDAEREQMQIWREQQVRLAEERQLEYRRRQAEIAGAKRIEAERQAAAARAHRNQEFQSELRKATDRQNRDRTLTGLLDHAVQQRQFRDAAVRSARHAAARQDLSSALDGWMQMKFPPPPPAPIPVEIVDDHPPGSCFGDRDFNVEAWSKRRRSWW